MTASVGSSIRGSGTSSTLTFSRPCQVSAFIRHRSSSWGVSSLLILRVGASSVIREGRPTNSLDAR